MAQLTRTRVEVLVVSHDRSSRVLMKGWIREQKFRVVACSSFESAREFLSKRVPAALVTDIHLGPFNGLQLVYVAKDGNPDVVVALLAEAEDSVLRGEARRVDAQFLVKPVAKDDLLNAISRIHA